jgi:hypothetical protein
MVSHDYRSCDPISLIAICVPALHHTRHAVVKLDGVAVGMRMRDAG